MKVASKKAQSKQENGIVFPGHYPQVTVEHLLLQKKNPADRGGDEGEEVARLLAVAMLLTP